MSSRLREAVAERPFAQWAAGRLAVGLFLEVQLRFPVAEDRPARLRGPRSPCRIKPDESVAIGAGQSGPGLCLEQQAIGRADFLACTLSRWVGRHKRKEGRSVPLEPRDQGQDFFGGGHGDRLRHRRR